MLIRRVRDGDWEACLEVELSYETEYAWQMESLEQNREQGARFREVRLPRKLRIRHPIPEASQIQNWKAAEEFLVAIEHRQIIGFIGVRQDLIEHQVRVVDFGVTTEYRRQGVGTSLLRRSAEWCVRQRISHLVLPCPLKAHPAIQFANKHRFNFGGFQEDYWPDHEVALLFYQRLRP